MRRRLGALQQSYRRSRSMAVPAMNTGETPVLPVFQRIPNTSKVALLQCARAARFPVFPVDVAAAGGLAFGQMGHAFLGLKGLDRAPQILSGRD